MNTNGMTPWKCTGKGRHVMGYVQQTHNVSQLVLLRNALEGNGEGETDVLAVVDGYAADVRCSICGSIRTWVPGEQSLKRLLRHFQAAKAT